LFVEKLETGFTIIFMFYIVVLTVNIMIFVAGVYTTPSLQEILSASYKTPWGIVTSLFVHSDVPHLLNNMLAFFLFLMLLLSSNIFLSKDELKTRIKNSFLAIFSFPVMLNLFWICIFPDIKILGSSGIVYTLEGVCFGFSFLNSLKIRRIRPESQTEKRQLAVSLLSNLAIFVGFLFSLLVSPIGFLGSNNEAIIWLHGTSFCGGFTLAVLHLILKKVINKA